MCIAIYSPKGNDIPCEEYLRNCFDNNSDGAGFAFNHNGHVEIVKGFMNWNDFHQTFSDYASKFDFKSKGVLLHFRIATHGKVNASNCHPFPVTDKDKQLKKSKSCCDFACVHNGIISLTADKEKSCSDTYIFVRDYLSKISSNKGWFKNKANIKLIENLINSKMAILNGNGDIIATDGFKKSSDGNFYSNESYSYSYRYDFYDCCFPVFGQPLMLLKRGESALFDDGDVEDFEDNYPTAISRDGEIFFICDCYDGVKSEDLIFAGYGVFIDSNNPFDENGEIKPIEFREDLTYERGRYYGITL